MEPVPGVPIRGMTQRHTQASQIFHHFRSYSGFSYDLLEKNWFSVAIIHLKYKTEVGDSIPDFLNAVFPPNTDTNGR